MDTLSREMRALHDTISRSRAEHAALGRVATAVAEGEDAEAIFDLVAREVAGLLGYAAARVLRFEGYSAAVVGAWGTTARLAEADGDTARLSPTEWRRRPGLPLRGRRLRHRPDAAWTIRSPAASPARPARRSWPRRSALTPACGARWSRRPPSRGDPCPTAVRCLTGFADLIALAISNAEDRHRLATLAATDSLTGLANHRAFQERLAAERRRGRCATATAAVRCSCSISTGSRPSTTRLRPPGRRRRAGGRSPPHARGGARRATCWPASAARSSPGCCPRPTAPRPAAAAERLRAASSGAAPGPAAAQTVSAGRLRPHRRRRDAEASSASPTAPSTGPSAAGAT